MCGRRLVLRLRKELVEIADGILARGMRQSSRCCPSDSSGLLGVQFPLGAGDSDALAGAQADEIGLELGEGGKDIEEQLSHRIARVLERPAEGQFHA